MIERRKVVDYLLSGSHPVGRFKAAFFVALGYSSDAWQVFADDLRQLALDHEAQVVDVGRFGTKYLVHGTLEGPRGRSADVVTIWLMPAGGEPPRLVTAYPGD